MKCPVELLPWLAWSLSLDEWDSSWPESIKRQTITDSIPVHQIKGTVGAIRRALSGLNAEIELTEWFENGGVPFTAQLTALARNNLTSDGDTLLTPELIAQMWRIVAATKPARSQIYFGVGVQTDVNMTLSAGASSQSINRVQITPEVDNNLNTSAVYVSAGTTSTSINRVAIAPVADNQFNASTVHLQAASTSLQINRVSITI
jgi:phage tail P2-like protein